MLLGVEGWNPLLGGNAPNPYLTINCGYLLSYLERWQLTFSTQQTL
jgi:hypothetical protein